MDQMDQPAEQLRGMVFAAVDAASGVVERGDAHRVPVHAHRACRVGVIAVAIRTVPVFGIAVRILCRFLRGDVNEMVLAGSGDRLLRLGDRIPAAGASDGDRPHAGFAAGGRRSYSALGLARQMRVRVDRDRFAFGPADLNAAFAGDDLRITAGFGAGGGDLVFTRDGVYAGMAGGVNAGLLGRFGERLVLFVEGMKDIVIFRICRDKPLLCRTLLCLSVFLRSYDETLIHQTLDFFHGDRAVQQHRHPVPTADVVAFEVALLPGKHIGIGRVGEFHIENVHSLFAMKPQIFSRHIHDNPVPFAIILMAKYRIPRKSPPQIFRLGLVFLMYILQNIFS